MAPDLIFLEFAANDMAITQSDCRPDVPDPGSGGAPARCAAAPAANSNPYRKSPLLHGLCPAGVFQEPLRNPAWILGTAGFQVHHAALAANV